MALPNASLSLRVLARLLSYPDAELRAHVPDLRQALRAEGAVLPTRIGELDVLMTTLERGNAIENEAEYVQIFDRGRSTSLHLFEHVHGDSRDRGPAMIDLAQTYEKAGLFLAPGEMPDYLPVVLEFVSTQPPKAGTRLPWRDGAHLQCHLQCAAATPKSLCERAGCAAGTQRRARAGGPDGSGRGTGHRLGGAGGL
jgi:nitrate reductase molybdenum cofactor assembly chaperone